MTYVGGTLARHVNRVDAGANHFLSYVAKLFKPNLLSKRKFPVDQVSKRNLMVKQNPCPGIRFTGKPSFLGRGHFTFTLLFEEVVNFYFIIH
ncbi:MAG: hypothetical protein BTN85_1201 [Candidatus Methanohalarchaeum thermophilum]|uniref:Uncharacterized protein n=1 Tax=Methanohalarchaeum thermophilum TaxID=1903181 RepID=A0A1Q6DWG2_METT1|nr:MAG: hypothetical protein BTN85_1201 [Candidatus Methanohalarchaeum thermophilum]